MTTGYDRGSTLREFRLRSYCDFYLQLFPKCSSPNFWIYVVCILHSQWFRLLRDSVSPWIFTYNTSRLPELRSVKTPYNQTLRSSSGYDSLELFTSLWKESCSRICFMKTSGILLLEDFPLLSLLILTSPLSLIPRNTLFDTQPKSRPVHASQQILFHTNSSVDDFTLVATIL